MVAKHGHGPSADYFNYEQLPYFIEVPTGNYHCNPEANAMQQPSPYCPMCNRHEARSYEKSLARVLWKHLNADHISGPEFSESTFLRQRQNTVKPHSNKQGKGRPSDSVVRCRVDGNARCRPWWQLECHVRSLSVHTLHLDGLFHQLRGCHQLVYLRFLQVSRPAHRLPLGLCVCMRVVNACQSCSHWTCKQTT